jgi:NB-ARC domain/APAF-1 helical domain
VATGDKVVAIKDVLEQYRSDWPKLIGIEMEAGGLASAAFQSPWRPGFLMIRGTSDLADEHKEDSWRQYACHAAAAYAVGLLQSGPVTFSKQEEGDQREKHTDLGKTQEHDQGSITTSGMPPHLWRRHDSYQLVSLPPHYIERSQILAEVQKVLLNETSPIALTSATMTTPAALHGMGGIGKTSVARALCDDPAVQQAFPDGILWATLGQKPDLVNQLRLWIQALGGAAVESAPTIDSLRLVLTQLLQERSCLLILDDVWRYEDAEQFRLGGPRCRLLLTTRQAEIAHRLGARIQSIPPLPSDDAITLLEAWARGHLASVERSVKEQIVKRLGYLPLAIRLAGPQLIHTPPQEWLQTFDVRDLRTRQVETTHDSLEVTFDLSLEMLQADELRLYLSLAIFPEDEAIPRVAIEQLWRSLGGLSAGKTALLLADLAERALLEPSPDEAALAVRLHDLLRDLMGIRLGEDGLVAAHRALLEAYRKANGGRGWHATADDGYLYDHLAYHLRAAGELQELKGLFANQGWQRARVAQHGYTYDGYLADLALALERASDEAGKQIEAGQAPESLAECIRYTLIRTSINSIAENSIPELIARAFQVGLWTTDQVMSTASRIPQAERQANTYLLLLETEQLNAKQREKAQQAVVDYALDVWDEDAKARINDIEGRDLFTALVPLLPEELLAAASHAILENTHRLYRSKTLAAVSPRLTGKLLEQTCEETLALPEAWERAECLRVLAAQLTESLLERALQAALAVENAWARSRMIAALVPRLEGAPLQQALENVLAISDDRPREWALTALAAGCELTGESLELARRAAYDLLRKGLLWPALLFAYQGQFEQRDQVMREIFEAFLAEKYQWSIILAHDLGYE